MYYREYDYVNDTIPQDSYSPRGVLINKKAVCEGYEAAFKAFAIALDDATSMDPWITDVLSTKGAL